MTLQLDPSRDLGLQNVLKTSAAYLRGSPSGAADGPRLVQELFEIFSDADRGSQRLGLRSLSVNPHERQELDRFGIFVRYLTAAYGDNLAPRLKETATVLEKLPSGQATLNEKERVATLIEELLLALKRERALRQPSAPRVLSYD